MQTFVHNCPYCGTELSVKELPEERTAAPCPHCKQTVILLDHGATMKKPFIYQCQKCGEKLIYENRPPYTKCDKCGTVYKTSEKGNAMIDLDLYGKGESGKLPYRKKPDRLVAMRNKWRMLPTKTKGAIFASIAALLCVMAGLHIYSLPPAIEGTQAYAEMENLWKEFREKNPYNLQIEGLKRYDDNSYVAIISEPNPNVTKEKLEKFFKSYNCSFRTFSKPIGYDGWLCDAVVCFNDLKEKNVPKFARKLSKLLYNTDYKASLLDLTTIPEHTPFSQFDLNYQVTEEELRKWFVEDNEPLVFSDDTTKLTTISQCLEQSGQSLLLSQTPGFVVWVMDIGQQKLDEYKVAARQFSLDSDLILGAIATASRVAIIGRERCVPVYELPPMRVETLCLLASAEDDELAQSYERTSLYAGKLTGGKDYAPIFLSPQLWHTEYGSTLNVTDQMLKSWSENGLIDYVDFDYPKPVNWAFNEGVMHDLGVTTLTYNWNTDGVGYIVDDDQYSIYAVNRTGSLPVSYIPGNAEGISASDPVYEAEQNAYDFFSSLSSPELVKVVQYAAMYQIFHNLEITVPAQEIDERQLIKVPWKLAERSRSVLRRLTNIDKNTRQLLAEDYDNVEIMDYDDYENNSKYNWGFVMPGRVAAATKGRNLDNLLELADYNSFISKIDTLSTIIRSLDDDSVLMRSLANFLTDRNADIEYTSERSPAYAPKIDISKYLPKFPYPQEKKDPGNVSISLPSFSSKSDRINFALRCLSRHGYALQRFNFKVSDLTTDECMKSYVECNREKSSEWIKCPTIVQSWSLVDSASQVGGHNLNSKVSRFKVNRDLKPGQTRTVERNGKKVVEVSAKDARTRVGDAEYLRKYGRLADESIQGREIPIRPKTIVTDAMKGRSGRGYNGGDHLTVRMDVSRGHTVGGKRQLSFEEMLEETGVFLEDGTAQFKQIEIEGLKGAGVDVNVFIDGVVGKMRKGSCTSIPLSKYDFAHYKVDYQGDKAIVTIPIKAGKIEFGSTSMVVEAGMGGSSKATPVLDIKGGEVEFRVPKSKLQAFKEMIEQFLMKQKGHWNEFKLKREMKRRGIDPADCEESTRLKVAKKMNKEKINFIEDVRYIQEKTIA